MFGLNHGFKRYSNVCMKGEKIGETASTVALFTVKGRGN